MIKLLDTFNVLEENQIISYQIDSYVHSGLRYTPRPYQISAINRFEYFLKDFNKRPLLLIFFLIILLLVIHTSRLCIWVRSYFVS